MKTLKVELIVEEDDGRMLIKSLTGDDAQQWQRWMNSVCLLAWNHHANPPWGDLKWQVREVCDETNQSTC